MLQVIKGDFFVGGDVAHGDQPAVCGKRAIGVARMICCVQRHHRRRPIIKPIKFVALPKRALCKQPEAFAARGPNFKIVCVG